MTHRRRSWSLIILSPCIALLVIWGLMAALSTARAWSEEDIEYFDPLDPTPLALRTTYTPTVSSIHFDLVGALAIAAGFSITDAATIQAFSQIVDSGLLPGADPVYALDADPANYPVPPDISDVPPSPSCPEPETISNTVAMGNYQVNKDKMVCPGCFTDRFGPYGTFFHMPHDRPDELGAVRAWAFGEIENLVGTVTYGYSTTVESPFSGIANVYHSTPCFVTETVTIDTGSVQPGSLQALGIYLHVLGDNWSHQECIAATDAQGLPFAAHVLPGGRRDPLWPCRWTSHESEFGDPDTFPDSNRTFSGTLAVYQALIDFAAQSDLPTYRPIPVSAEENHIYDTLYTFIHTATAANPTPRRQIANDLRKWALRTRATRPAYWPSRVYLPLVTR
ncbi:MAG: hypothetical protein ACE5F6_08500 [Anaerolineae bacterium]